jgi:two-component system, OmpR family, sensor histidine kinase QseC
LGQKSEISLQNQLIRSSVLSSMVAGLVALILLIVISLYQNMSMQDNIMDEISDLLLVSDISQQVGSELDELSEEFSIEYVLKLDRLVLVESGSSVLHADQHPVFFKHGKFGFIWFEGALYRHYLEHSNGQVLSMIQPMSIRVEQLLKSLIGYSGILLVVWLLQWLILHFIIRKQFRSLQQLSQQIAEKSVKDLTPIQQQEPRLKELQPMVSQINRMMFRLEQAISAEQRFTADASHELRSPLSAIQMRLQLLKRKYKNLVPEIDQDFEQILKDVNRGSNVLENLLLLARLDPSSAQDIPKSLINLESTLLEVIKALTLFSNAKHIKFNLDIHSESVFANQELLFSCLRNLVDNAIRYSPIDSEIYIKIERRHDLIFLSIENQGDGLDENVLSRLGERFYRELGTKTEGSGLGLSICKKIAELHGARLNFSKSTLGGLKVEIIFKS